MVARHFLCCLPLRLGALLISFFQLAASGAIAAVGWYTVISGMRGRLPSNLKVVIIVSAVYYTALAIAALLGFIGTLGRKARLLSTYAFYLSWSIGVQIIIDAVYLWAFFSQSRETLIQKCIDGSSDKEIQNICNQSFDQGKWSLVISLVIGLLIQLWAAYIVTSYARKLKGEETWRAGAGAGAGVGGAIYNTGPRYTHVHQDDNEHHIPLSGSHQYPYSGTPHSLGGSRAAV